jgi:L-alanine-DL-glutamate epimerase-like enolase superfamily enzyme
MKITDVRTVLLTGPSTNDPYLSESRKLRSAAYIEIHSDTELIGLGETYAGYFFPEGVPAIVEFFKPILVGQDLDETPIAELWSRMYHSANFWARVGLGVIVINGIEAALWDLKGKMRGVPVHELLGGLKHESLPAYATGGPSNFPLEKLAKKVDFYQSLGFRGFKVGAGSLEVKADGSVEHYIPMRPAEAADFEGRKVRFLREHVGRDVNVMLDGHMGNNDQTWDVGIAQAVMKAVEPYDLFFFEEPLHYTDPWGYAELARSTSVPIAGGECLTAAFEWRVFVDQDSFDIGQPDAAFTGGLLESLRVAAMLEARGRKIATHSWASGGGFMQNLHFGFAAANTVMLEIAPAFGPLHSEVVGESFRMKDGRVLPPEGVGLGIRLTDETKARFPFKGGGEFNSVPGKILID